MARERERGRERGRGEGGVREGGRWEGRREWRRGEIKKRRGVFVTVGSGLGKTVYTSNESMNR